jgi:hypothetical protein
MQGNFLPGEHGFWIYLTIAVPMLPIIILTLIMNFFPWIQSWVSLWWHIQRRYRIINEHSESGLLPRFHVEPVERLNTSEK